MLGMNCLQDRFRGSVRFIKEGSDVHIGELAISLDALPVNENVPDVRRIGLENGVAERIDRPLAGKAVPVANDHDVRLLARRERADPVRQTHRFGAVHRDPFEGIATGDRQFLGHCAALVDRVVVGKARGRQRQPHLRDQIARVQRDDIAAEGGLDLVLTALAEGRPAHAHVHLGLHRNGDVRAAGREAAPVLVVERRAMNVHMVGAEQPCGIHFLDAGVHHRAPETAGMHGDAPVGPARRLDLRDGFIPRDEPHFGQGDAEGQSRRIAISGDDALIILNAFIVGFEDACLGARIEEAITEQRANAAVAKAGHGRV